MVTLLLLKRGVLLLHLSELRLKIFHVGKSHKTRQSKLGIV